MIGIATPYVPPSPPKSLMWTGEPLPAGIVGVVEVGVGVGVALSVGGATDVLALDDDELVAGEVVADGPATRAVQPLTTIVAIVTSAVRAAKRGHG
jgi:hypothetical protein